jgi:hypothetical protein
MQFGNSNPEVPVIDTSKITVEHSYAIHARAAKNGTATRDVVLS